MCSIYNGKITEIPVVVLTILNSYGETSLEHIL